MQVHQLTKSKVKTDRIGRGGKRGSYSGRGIKGQKSRAGRKIRPAIRDIIKKMHKLRGHGKNRGASSSAYRSKPYVVNLDSLEKHFSAKGGSALGGKDGEKITRASLIKAGLIREKKGKKLPIKILGSGANKKVKFSFEEGFAFSESVKKNVE